jgi:hypothetical protein
MLPGGIDECVNCQAKCRTEGEGVQNNMSAFLGCTRVSHKHGHQLFVIIIQDSVGVAATP